MDVKFSHLLKAIEHLRSDAGLYNDDINHTVLSINVVEDNPGEGRMCECLVLKCSVVKPPGKYDDKVEVVKEWTIEVFADGENRPPRSVCVKTQDIDVSNKR